jgi:uncharacterized membrane protein
MGLSSQLKQQVQDLVQPGTSAPFMIVNKMPSDKTIAALSKYGGTVLKSSLPTDVEKEIQEALHGAEQPAVAATCGTPS